MCGRYGLYDISESELLMENKGYNFKPNYNVAPTQTMPIILSASGDQLVRDMQWGITRKVGPDVEKSIFNTRSEKALDRFWGKTVKTHRCLVPANGFYEWKKTSDGKTPYFIHSPDTKLIYFAGIFDQDHEGNSQYSIMTTTPNREMSDLHDRMPVILQKDAMDAWLEAEENETDLLSDLMRPLPNDTLEIYEVSRDVNYVRNNTCELIVPLNSK